MTVTPDDRLLVDPDPALAGAIAKTFGLAANAVDVIAPEVGGGFGAKLNVYADEILVSYASMQLGRPVKYTESRRVAEQHDPGPRLGGNRDDHRH